MRRLALILATVLLLAACGKEELIRPPEIVEVTVTKYVPVPAELSRDCDEVPKEGNDYQEAIRLANARLASLEECNGRLRKIRGLGD